MDTLYKLTSSKSKEDFVLVSAEHNTQELLDCALKDETEIVDKVPQLISDQCLNCISPLQLEMSTMRPLDSSPKTEISEVYYQHIEATEREVLGDNHWALGRMAHQICSSISPEAIHDAFDPRSLVHVKKHVLQEGVDCTTLYDGAALSGKVGVSDFNVILTKITFSSKLNYNQNGTHCKGFYSGFVAIKTRFERTTD